MDFQNILTFWFEETDEKLWFVQDDGFDALIRERFFDVYQQAKAGAFENWKETPEGCLALILVLDQFPRNLFRDSGEAFATDEMARELTYYGLARGYDFWLHAHKPDDWQAFLYMPLMHSEDEADQARCVDVFMTFGFTDYVPFAHKHAEIIRRFGRFPHRNNMLGRESTAAEVAFLKNSGGGRGF